MLVKSIIGYYRAVKTCKGSSNVFIVCMSLFLIILLALVTDIGYAAVARYKLANSAEKTARAGARALVLGKRSAEVLMKQYAVKETSGLTELDLKISDNSREITVYMKKPFEYLFLKVFGVESKQIKARVTAKLSGVMSFKGIRPFAVEKQQFIFGKQYTLVNYSTNDEYNVSFSPLSLGSGNYENNVIYGYIKTLNVGDVVYPLISEEKNITADYIKVLLNRCEHKPGCTYNNYSDKCSRIIVIPVVDKITFTEESAMKILGFTAFFLEDAGFDKGKLYIKGRFIKHAVKAKTSDSIEDYGLAGIKMIR